MLEILESVLIIKNNWLF